MHGSVSIIFRLKVFLTAMQCTPQKIKPEFARESFCERISGLNERIKPTLTIG
jgi:hypothetical protein